MDERRLISGTLSDLFYASADNRNADLRDRLHTRRALPELDVRVDADALREQTVHAIVEVLATPLDDLLLWAWTQHRDIRRACDETRDVPGSRRPVVLSSHTFESTQRPHLVVDIDGIDHSFCELAITVTLTIAWATLTVTSGRIESVQLGQVTSMASLTSGSWLRVTTGPRVLDLDLIDLTREADPKPTHIPSRPVP